MQRALRRTRRHGGRPPRPPHAASRWWRGALPAALLGCGLVAACHQAPVDRTGAAASPSAEATRAGAARTRPEADPARALPTFTVEVTLSDAAASAFRRSGETVIVAASYFGTPKPGIDPHDIDDIGEVDLGQVQKELPGAGSATFAGSSVPKARLELIQGAPQVNINVYSGRHTSPDNLLGCDMFQGSVAFAARKPRVLHCALLTEQYDTSAITEPAPASSR